MPKIRIEDYPDENYNPYAIESMKPRNRHSKEAGRREDNQKDRAIKAMKNTQQGIRNAAGQKDKRR